jgi:histidinol-phosphate aminotransferase
MTSPKDKIEQWIRPEVRALSAYHVPDPGKLIKLDAMENPYPWPEQLVNAWLERLRGCSFNRYPDPGAAALKARMREAMSVPAAAQVVLGNGSDELIQMIIQSVAMPGRVIMAPEPTFVMYRQIAAVAGLEFAGVPLQADFSLDRDAMLQAIEAQRPAVIFLAYPNNPTGNLFGRDVLIEILARAPGLVVVDEAYAPFTDASFMSELPAYPDLLVLRTLSKMGFAGLRLGLLAGAPDWLAQIEKTRLPYNISSINQFTGEFALEYRELFDRQAAAIRAARTRLHAAMAAIEGVTLFPSEANFILFRVPQGQGQAVFAGLKSRGVLIKNLDGSAAALRDCLRVTVGTPEENAMFVAALAETLAVAIP